MQWFTYEGAVKLRIAYDVWKNTCTFTVLSRCEIDEYDPRPGIIVEISAREKFLPTDKTWCFLNLYPGFEDISRSGLFEFFDLVIEYGDFGRPRIRSARPVPCPTDIVAIFSPEIGDDPQQTNIPKWASISEGTITTIQYTQGCCKDGNVAIVVLDEGKTCIFSGLDMTVDTLNEASFIIRGIIKNLGFDPFGTTFYDMQTHIGNPTGLLFGEFRYERVVIENRRGAIVAKGWVHSTCPPGIIDSFQEQIGGEPKQLADEDWEPGV